MSNFVEIRPRELKPALLELEGISRTTIEALKVPVSPLPCCTAALRAMSLCPSR